MKVSDFGAVLATSRARVVVPLPRVYGVGEGEGLVCPYDVVL